MEFIKWLYPGLGIKRWLVLGIMGFTLVSVGMAIISDTPILGMIELSTKDKVINISGGNSLIGGMLALGVGIISIIISFRKVVKAFIKAVFPEFARSQVRPLHQERLLRRGPKVVVIGGGTGLSVLLRGLKEYTSNITAIVSVADDGGSSGRLRDQLGILPPGDIRNCLVALADKEALMEEVLNYRFKHGDELAGHNLGNLFLAAMTDMYGNFEEAVRQMSRVLAIRGKVIPSTLEHVTLCAEMADGTVISGESNISRSLGGIKRIFIQPEMVKPLDEAIEAIHEADGVILGPGSLYTSIIPNLLVGEIAKSINNSKGIKIYVCNVMTQPGETSSYTAGDHLEAIYNHCPETSFDYIIVNDQPISDRELLAKYTFDGAEQVEIDEEKLAQLGVKVLAKPLLDERKLLRHNSKALGRAIIELILTKKKYKTINLIDKLILLEKLKTR